MKKTILLVLTLLSAFLMTNCNSLLNAEDAKYLYFTSTGNGTVQKSNLDGTSVQTLYDGTGDCRGIAVDEVNQKIYFVEGNAVLKCDINGSNVTTIASGFNTPRGLSLDSANSKLYLAGNIDNTIHRMNLDGSNVESFATVNFVSGVHVDPNNNRVFYCSTSGGGNPQIGYISGSTNNVIISGNATAGTDPNGIYYDHSEDMVYVAAWSSGWVYKIKPDGSSQTFLSQALTSPAGIVVDSVNNKVYWGSNGGNIIQKSNSSGTDIQTAVSSAATPYQVALSSQ